MKKFYLFILSTLLLLITFRANSQVCYVKPGGPYGNGTSWENAFPDLDLAIDAVNMGQFNEIRMLAGTYNPFIEATNGLITSTSFWIKRGVTIKGGYKPGSSSALEVRDPALYPTVLDGDYAHTPGLTDDDAQHVIVANSAGTVTLDGLTITNGNAVLPPSLSQPEAYGGGILSLFTNLRLNNVVLVNNIAEKKGGGIYLTGGNITLNNTWVKNNKAPMGGGIALDQGSASPTFLAVSSAIVNNTSAGGTTIYTKDGTTFLINCTIANNTGTGYQAMIGNLNIHNCIFRNNLLAGNPSDLVIMGVTGSSSNNISDVALPLAGVNNTVGQDPGFVSSSNLSLKPTSIAINTGNNTPYSAGSNPDLSAFTTDIAGKPRIYNSGTVDIGAYEYQAAISTVSVLGVTTTDPLLNNYDQVHFTVTFAQSVTGLTAANFSLPGGGTILSVTPVTGTNNQQWTVTVKTVESDNFPLLLDNQNGLPVNLFNIPAGSPGYAIDKTAPTITSANLYSNNTVPTLAKTGDKIQLNLTASEDIKTVTATIAGKTATVTLLPPTRSQQWITVADTDPDGPVTARVTLTDMAGNSTVYNIPADIAAGQPVYIDNTAPQLTVQPLTTWLDINGNVTITQSMLNYLVSDPPINDPVTISFTPRTLDISNMGDNTFTLTATDKAGNITNKNFTVTLANRSVSSLAPLSPATFTVPYGTSLTGLLPVTTTVNWQDGGQTVVSLNWDNSPYNALVAGAYTLQAAPVLHSTWTSAGQKVSAIINVNKRVAVNVTPPATVITELGTDFAALGLPSTLPATYSPVTTNTNPVDVTWQPGSYNPAVAGTYTLTGTIVPDASTDLPAGLQTINITVVVKKRVISSIPAINPVSVPYGSAPASILPATVMPDYAVSNPGNPALNISWDLSSYDPLTAGIYTINGTLTADSNTDTNGQPMTTSVTVTVNKRTISGITPATAITVPYGTAPAATGLPSQIAATYTPATSNTTPLNVTWNTSSYDPLTVGTYTIPGTLTADNNTDITGQPMTTSVTVTVSKRIITSITPATAITVPYGTAPAALGLPSQIAAVYTPATSNTTPLSVTWNTSSYDPLTAGTYTIPGTLTADNNTDITGQPMTTSITVNVSKRTITSTTPVTAITVPYGTAPAAIGLPSQITAAYTPATSNTTPLSVTWNTNSYDPLTAGTYNIPGTLIADNNTDITGQPMTTSVTVTVGKRTITNITPAAAITVPYGTAPAAIGLPSQIVAVYTPATSNTTPLNVTWNTSSYDPLTAGTYTIPGTLTADNNTDITGQPMTTSVTVTVSKRTIAAITPVPPKAVPYGTNFVTVGLPSQITATYSPATTNTTPLNVNWLAGNYNPAVAGTYTITGVLTADNNTDVTGQNMTISTDITVNKRSVVSVTTPAAVQVAYLTPFGSIGLPATVPAVYTDNTSGNISVQWDASTYNRSTPGTYVLHGTLQPDTNTDNSQNISTSFTVTVLQGTQRITTAAVADKYEGDATFTLQASSDAGLPLQFTSSNPAVIAMNGNQATPGIPGTATITITQSGDVNYIAATPVTITIKVLAWPDAAISANGNTTICENETLTLQGATSGQYQWFLNGAAVSGSNKQTFRPTASGNYNATVTYTNGFIKTSNTIPVTVNPLPDGRVAATGSTTISKGASIQLQASGGSSYAWTPAQWLDNPSSATPVARPAASIRYEVVITSSAGCSVRKQIDITLEDDFKVTGTNVLTPNGDGINDNWVVKNLDMYPDNEVKVFDRAGRLVFQARNYNNTWNGTVNGQPLSEGTYYYIITVGQNIKTFKGYITIVR
ncbi:Ig-like domain-containing protein [Chitinophaga sp. HK235]|uniref:Ig-like domain-containing protein n=1 Tax=Chitinophaga sp. HK235 TaxID=2952571 RepID=UPI001BA48941|nr:Ig-like domain-containing protein [Chitinophaga sp. HK235]